MKIVTYTECKHERWTLETTFLSIPSYFNCKCVRCVVHLWRLTKVISKGNFRSFQQNWNPILCTCAYDQTVRLTPGGYWCLSFLFFSFIFYTCNWLNWKQKSPVISILHFYCLSKACWEINFVFNITKWHTVIKLCLQRKNNRNKRKIYGGYYFDITKGHRTRNCGIASIGIHTNTSL